MEAVDQDYEMLLLNKQDMPPNVMKGCSSDELLLALGVSFSAVLPVCVILALIVQIPVVYGAALSPVLTAGVTWKVLGIIGKAKVGKPHGWYMNKVRIYLRYKFGATVPFLRYAGQWTILRELRSDQGEG